MTKKNIVLIGFMGTGKTAVGKRLATLLNREFFDSDHEVEAVTGMTVSQLFNKYGEIRFRSEENLVLKRLAKKKNCIIATGGGAVLDPENIRNLAENSIVICLYAKPEIIYERVRKRNNRPLLKKGDLYTTICELMKEREDFYQCADFRLDTSELSFQEIIDKITILLKEKINIDYLGQEV